MVPDRDITSVDSKQFGTTVNKKDVDPDYNPFALVIVPVIVIV